MNKKKIEYIITAFLVFILIFFSVKGFFEVRKSKVDKKISKVEDIQVREHGEGSITSDEEDIIESKDFRWSRDPFFANKYVKKKESLGDNDDKSINLTGIVWDEINPKAVIDGMIVGEGDKIGLYEVVNIEPDSVILQNDKEKLKIMLGQE